MAEWSKAPALGAGLFGGAGSNPVLIKLLGYVPLAPTKFLGSLSSLVDDFFFLVKIPNLQDGVKI